MSENKKKQARCWMTETTFEIGDVVTRGGYDRQKIIDIDDDGFMIEVECIREPLGFLMEDGTRGEPWCKIGDRERNLTRRYSFPEELVIEIDDYLPDGELDATLARIRRSNYSKYYKDAMLSLRACAITYGVKPSVQGRLVHPVAEVEAYMNAIQISLGNPETRRSVVAEFGLDVEEVDAENARDKARLAAMDGGAA